MTVHPWIKLAPTRTVVSPLGTGPGLADDISVAGVVTVSPPLENTDAVHCKMPPADACSTPVTTMLANA
jgi:hypothetical protein